eukprot:9258487-Pyramimonas_sp.AAC.1
MSTTSTNATNVKSISILVDLKTTINNNMCNTTTNDTNYNTAHTARPFFIVCGQLRALAGSWGRQEGSRLAECAR